MNNALRMNNFLQRMLKKSDDESECDKVVYDSVRQQVEYSPRSSKSNWMSKLGGYSPRKRDLSPSMRSPSRPITPKPSVNRYEYRRRIFAEPLTLSKNSVTKAEMPDLEKIIQDFEEGYLSPTKHEIQETFKSGRFVKQIVAAIEEKYKARTVNKAEAEKSSSKLMDDNKTLENDVTSVENETDNSEFLMGRTYVLDNLEHRFSHYLDSDETKSGTSSRHSDDSIDLGMCSFAMDEELAVSTPAKKLHDSTLERSANLNSVMLEKTVTQKSSKTAESKTLVRSNSSLRRERQPKIVGAFLKKPIEVEDTSVNWIPITDKKLPRKKSFKRLLSILTGKKTSDKSSKLYCSQMNLHEENSRELHDSGYDEKSCSSSSLTSLVSIADVLLHQDKHEINVDRRTLTTFQQSNPIDIGKNSRNVKLTTFRQSSSDDANSQNYDDDALADNVYDTCSINSKKLLLEEVPRSEVRLSLGPAFPSGPRLVKSSDDNDKIDADISQDVSEYSFDESSYDFMPPASPLPKHPFVSSNEKYQEDSFETEKDVNFNCLNKVEVRRDTHSWQFPSAEITYDVPRRYMSKSEPGLVMIGRDATDKKITSNDVVYDVPKRKIPQRPRSSVYEDALSLKRRNADFSYSPPASGFYAFPSQEEPHYATVKPRNTRICPSRELMRSTGDLNARDRRIDSFYSR